MPTNDSSTINTGDFRETVCPPDVALVLVDPPYNLGKRYAGTPESYPYEDWVHDLLGWSTAPWTLVLGPHPTMYDWLAKVPRPTRIIYWHRTFTLPRKGLRAWTDSMTPILVYQQDDAPWYGEPRASRYQHDCIDAHNSLGDTSRLKRLGIHWDKHPSVTGTQLPTKIIPFLVAPDSLVVDPMCGVGSILVAAQRLGRRTWGCEIEAGYAEAAREWLAGEAKLT